MNAKTMTAMATLLVGTGVIAAVVLMGAGARDDHDDDGARPVPPPETRVDDLFSVATPPAPSPAQIFRDSARGPMPAEAHQRMGGWMTVMSRLIDRMDEFDIDGDGKLSDLEKMAMGMKLRKEWIAEHDLDGDGKMSGAEWERFQRSMFEQTAAGQQLLRQFDLDGDGVLNEQEQAALDAHLQEQEQQRRAEEHARMDTDGDGEVSQEERRAARRQEREFWQSQMAAAENGFDYDGDGELNIEETRDAWDAWAEYQTIEAFISRYDTDGDGSIGPPDYDAFLTDYDRKDPRADVNNDGQINVADINAFRDLVRRSR